jgi:hypothetical protein
MLLKLQQNIGTVPIPVIMQTIDIHASRRAKPHMLLEELHASFICSLLEMLHARATCDMVFTETVRKRDTMHMTLEFMHM